MYSSDNSKDFKILNGIPVELVYGTGQVIGLASSDKFCFEDNSKCLSSPIEMLSIYDAQDISSI